MIRFTRPYYGSISEKIIRGVCQHKENYYVLDGAYNKYEISKQDYDILVGKGYKIYDK